MPDIAVVVAVVVAIFVVFLVVRAMIGRVTIFEYQRGIKYVGGRFAGLLGPGQHWVYRPSTYVQPVDTRESLMIVQGQEVVSSDSVAVKISLVARYRITDPQIAITQIENYYQSVYGLLQIALREVLGTMAIEDALRMRDEIGSQVLDRTTAPAKAMGVELLGVDVRDFMFPGALKRTFSQVLEAKQQGLAALEKARGETAALRSLANAARMVEANPALLQLRLVQQLEATRGHTIVLGMPAASTPLPIRSEQTADAPELEPGRSSNTEQ